MKKDEKKRAGGRRIIILLLVLAVALVAAAFFGRVGKDGESSSSVKIGRDGNDFNLESGKNCVHTSFGDMLVSSSSTGLRVIDLTGEELFRIGAQLSSPAVTTAGSYGIAYDVGGTTAIFFDRDGIIESFQTENEIVSCSVCSEGIFAVTTGMSSYKTAATVYDGKCKPIYRWSTGSGYVLSTALNDTGTTIAGCVICDEGSKIITYDLDSDLEKSSCTLEGVTALDLKLVNRNTSVVLTSGGLYRISYGEPELICDFGDRLLSAAELGGNGYSVVALLDYSVGTSGIITVVSDTGQILGETETEKRLTSLSANGDMIAVLWPDGLAVYNKNMSE
ncbi:MAG: hypothetical protein HUJ65_00640, partial [Oscillospiraceae bacterium]|nr:hypothetical protein [Oscillospiraceae bacterium]